MSLIIILLIIILLIYFYKKLYVYESFYDLTPYKYHWDIFKCLDGKCIRQKGKDCYDWCNKWPEDGGRHNCRLVCLDNSDLMYQELKLDNYIFGRLLPKFNEVSLLNE